MGTAAAGAAVLGAVAGATRLVPKVAAGSIGTTGSVGDLPAARRLSEATIKAAPVLVPSKWSNSADVVVVGYGSAGAVAAITAFDEGANVLILEKTPSLASLGVANNNTHETLISGGGGNSHICGGICFFPLDPVNGALWHYSMSFGATPMVVSEAWATMSVQNRAWLDAMSIPYTYSSSAVEYPNFPGASSGFATCTPTDSGPGLFYFLDQLVTVKRSIPVLFNTRGTALIQDPATGEILGVQALQNQSEVVNIQAKRAVVLTTGGYEFDATMKLNYEKMAPYHFGGWQYNTGDGIKMAMAAGAGLWHMNTTSGRLSPWTPTFNTCYAINALTNNYIWTDRYGNRFCNESNLPGHSAWQAVVDWNFQYGEYSRVPAMWVMDSKLYNSGPIASAEGSITHGINAVPLQLGGTGTNGTFTGSAVGTAFSNSAGLAAGYIIQGADIPTLAANIAAATIIGSNQGMPVPPGWNSQESMDNVTLPGGTSCPHYSATNLQAAVNQWNADFAAGKGDTVFGRTQITMAPISTPPYYAIALWPAGPNTNGGPIRDQTAHVCDPYYKPIPRLYSAGELGSVWGFLYNGGGNIGESVAFGRIAGNNAASEVPWTS